MRKRKTRRTKPKGPPEDLHPAGPNFYPDPQAEDMGDYKPGVLPLGKVTLMKVTFFLRGNKSQSMVFLTYKMRLKFNSGGVRGRVARNEARKKRQTATRHEAVYSAHLDANAPCQSSAPAIATKYHPDSSCGYCCYHEACLRRCCCCMHHSPRPLLLCASVGHVAAAYTLLPRRLFNMGSWLQCIPCR